MNYIYGTGTAGPGDNSSSLDGAESGQGRRTSSRLLPGPRLESLPARTQALELSETALAGRAAATALRMRSTAWAATFGEGVQSHSRVPSPR